MIYRLIFTIIILIPCLNTFSKPLGTIKTNDSTYVDESEIDIGSWLSYYTWTLEHEGLNAAQKILPDSNAIDIEVWRYINAKTEKYNNTLAHSTGFPIGFFNSDCKDSKKYGKRLRSIHGCCPFIGLPITGITFEQAIKFCEWRTNVVYEKKLICRLPAPDEWKEIAIKGFTINGSVDTLTNGNCPSFNYHINCQCDKDSAFGKLNSIAMWMPDKNGIYDLFGSVSEMTSKQGIAKGGNFNLFAIQCNQDSIQYYEKPQKWLGFRCIIVEKRR